MPTATEVLAAIWEAGLSVEVDGDSLRVTPRSSLTDALRAGIREHKPELALMLATPKPNHPCGCGLSQWWFRAVRVEGGGLVGDWLCCYCHPDLNATDEVRK